MKAIFTSWTTLRLRPPRGGLREALANLVAQVSCATLDAPQRKWIFHAIRRNDAFSAKSTVGMEDRWIEFESQETGMPVKLHGLWLAALRPDAPVLLYLHGAGSDLRESAERMQRLHRFGFSVLGIDYRGFGQSTEELPSEDMACEDARVAWRWLAAQHPGTQRYLYGHSLGAALAVHVAGGVEDAAGLIVEGSFPSLSAVFRSFRWGWQPLTGLITQRFDVAQHAANIKSPVLVVHGSHDRLIAPELGRQLFECIMAPKRFLLVEGGAHHNTDALGNAQCREALRELFGLTVH